MDLGNYSTEDLILTALRSEVEAKHVYSTLAEGVKNAECIYRLSQKMEVEMPIIEQVYLMLYADKSPQMVVKALMGRKLKSESVV